VGNPVAHIELTTENPEKAKDFYGKLFEWNLEDYPMPEGGTYTMIRPGNGTGGGMMKSPPGVPTAWTPYISVDDAARATEKARSLGATVVKDVTSVPGYGAFSVLADPTGGVFGIWANEAE